MSATKISDLGRIEKAAMRFPSAPVWDVPELQKLIHEDRRLTVYGQRHSQGGQSLCDDGLASDMDLMQTIQINQDVQGPWFADVPAGATWDHLHRALARHTPRLAPVTHQSSPYFSIGGSLAVNCHGRDPRQGPLSSSVRGLKVLLADGSTQQLERNLPADRDMLGLILGGFGAGAVILRAQLALKPEVCLQHDMQSMETDDYQQWLNAQASNNSWPPMHHAWLRCVNDNGMFREVLCSSSHEVQQPLHLDDPLQLETVLSDDALSVVYNLYRDTPTVPDKVLWAALTAFMTHTKGKVERTLNAMRAPVRFTLSPPFGSTDLLQEFFLPLGKLDKFLEDAATVWRGFLSGNSSRGVKLLTSTVRVVQADALPILSYAPDDGPRAAVVFNYCAPIALAQPSGNGASVLDRLLVQKLIDAALKLGGRPYLAYSRSATDGQFVNAYGAANVALFKQLRKQKDSTHKFDNLFLQTYLN